MEMADRKRMKIMYVISLVDYALGFDWLDQFMDKVHFDVHYVFLHPKEPELHRLFCERGVQSTHIPYHSVKDMPGVSWKLFRLFKSEKPDWVHAHLFDACLAALPAAMLAGVKGRTFTRHHSTVHHVYHPKMVWVDKFLNALATDIVAISQNVYEVLTEREKVLPAKVRIIHHGFDLNRFSNRNPTAVALLQQRYNPQAQRPVIGVISRFTHWKGVQYIIPAFKEILNDYPDALLVMANARGEYQEALRALLAELPKRNYIEIDFEKDLFSLYGLFDIFVHVPIDASAEAYGQIYVEALAAGVPSIFTLSGISREFIRDRENALVVPFCASEPIANAMKTLLSDDSLKRHLVKQGMEDVNRLFPVQTMMDGLRILYFSRKRN